MRNRMDELLGDYGYRADRPTRRIAKSPRGQHRRRRPSWLGWVLRKLLHGCTEPELAPVRSGRWR